MATPQESRALYNSLVNSGNVSYATLPDGAAAIALTAAAAWVFGAWAQIVATVGAAAVWLCGIGMAAPSAPASEYDVDIGQGAGAAEVSIAELPYFDGMLWLPHMVRVVAATRLAGRTRSSSGAADTIAVKVVVALGLPA